MLIRPEGFQHLFLVMDTIQEMRGAGVVYLDGNSTRMVRTSAHTSGLDTWLVMEEIDLEPAEPKAPPKPYKQTNREMLGNELLSAGLNCGAMVLLGIASAGSTVCSVGTAGACTPLLVLSAVGAAATGAQCGMSLARVGIAIADPDSIGLANLDSQAWYQGVSVGLEVASFVGTGASAVGAFKKIRAGRSIAQLGLNDKIKLGKDLSNFLRYQAQQESVNGWFLRWATKGRLNAIFFDATRTLTINKLQLVADVMSNLLSVAGNVTGDVIGPMLQRGIRMTLVQNQKTAPLRSSFAYYDPNYDFLSPPLLDDPD
jgi:hypothetical protein